MKKFGLVPFVLIGSILSLPAPILFGQPEADEPAETILESDGGQKAGAGEEGEGDGKERGEIELPVRAEGATPESQLSGLLFQEGPALPFRFVEKEEEKESPYPEALFYDDFDEFRSSWRRSGSSWSEYGGALHGRDVRPFTSPPRATANFSATDLVASFRFSLGQSGQLTAVLNGDDGFGNTTSLITINLTRTRFSATLGGATANSGDADVVRTFSGKPAKVGKLYRTRKLLVSQSANLPSEWTTAGITFESGKFIFRIDGVEIFSCTNKSFTHEKRGIAFVPGTATVSIDDVLVE